jgi:two-component system nitrate/nitrite response regulator NarL
MLRVMMLAREPERRKMLAAMLLEAGHAIAASAEEADVAIHDLGPDERIEEEDAQAVVLLSDANGLGRDPEFAAVLPRAASIRQIEAAMQAVLAGLTVRVRSRAPLSSFASAEDDASALLTPRELEILAAIGDGLSNKQAARQLGISAHTVKFHLEAIFAKLHANTRAEAVAKGLRRGLIEA